MRLIWSKNLSGFHWTRTAIPAERTSNGITHTQKSNKKGNQKDKQRGISDLKMIEVGTYLAPLQRRRMGTGSVLQILFRRMSTKQFSRRVHHSSSNCLTWWSKMASRRVMPSGYAVEDKNKPPDRTPVREKIFWR